MNKLDTTKTGGQPFVLDDIRFNDTAYRNAFNSILKVFGTNLIVQGCEVNGNDVAAGYVLLNGELIKVDAHVRTGDYYSKVTTYDAAGNKTFKNGQIQDVYEINRAVCAAGAGPLAYNGRRIFGNTAGQACEGNDARLSDSRRCNNTFDDAAAARNAMDVFSKAETNAAIAAIVNGAPGALDTLYELAAALGNDPNLSATLLNAIANEATARANAVSAEANARQTADTILQDNINAIDLYVYEKNPSRLITKVIPIGPWDIPGTAGIKDVAHGIADRTKIISCSVYLINDNGLDARQLHNDDTDTGNSYYRVMAANVEIVIASGSYFRTADDWGLVATNRGHIVIEYLP